MILSVSVCQKKFSKTIYAASVYILDNKQIKLSVRSENTSLHIFIKKQTQKLNQDYELSMTNETII